MVCEQLFGGEFGRLAHCWALHGTCFKRFQLRFEKRYDWFKDCGDKEVLKESLDDCCICRRTLDQKKIREVIWLKLGMAYTTY